jgi:hypothetical protein
MNSPRIPRIPLMDGSRRLIAGGCLLLVAGAPGCAAPPPAAHGPAARGWQAAELLQQDEFADLARWQIEQRPGGTVAARDGALVIDDAEGCTVWFRPALEAPVIITYDAVVVDGGGAHDRVSDLKCFWMATDPAAPGGDVLATSARSTGALAEYDALRLYYVGAGGNANTTTRFRRYTGTGERPLLPEHDLRDRRFLLRGNQTYHVILLAAEGRVQYLRDGVVFFDYADPQPLTTGRFGFRTVHSRIELRHFRVWRARVAND